MFSCYFTFTNVMSIPSVNNYKFFGDTFKRYCIVSKNGVSIVG